MLFEVKNDPSESTDLHKEHPDVAGELAAKFDAWWDSLEGSFLNESAVGPPVNPFKELFWKQFGGGPSKDDLRLMDMNQNPATRTIPSR